MVHPHRARQFGELAIILQPILRHREHETIRVSHRHSLALSMV